MGVPIPKEKPERDKRYLDWIRSLPCHLCRYPPRSDAHHVKTGGTATKCSDYLTVPLCKAFARGCHAKADKSKQLAAKLEPVAMAYRIYYRRHVEGK